MIKIFPFFPIGGGGFAIAPPVYTSEISETSIRGAMGSVMQFMLTIGLAGKINMPLRNRTSSWLNVNTG